MYSSGRPSYAGSCLFLVTRATIIGPEHGGPPTAALGPYHSAILLGGVEDTQAGSLSSAFAYWPQAMCDVDALPRAKADSYPYVARFALTGTHAKSECSCAVVVGRVQELKRTCLRAWDSERGADAVARM